MSNAVETAAARNRYRTLRAASSLSSAAFDAQAERLARDFADGETVEPRHWTMAAEQALYDRGEWRDGL